VSRAVQYLKGKSSHKLLTEYQSLRKRYWGQHLWSRGYWVATSGNVTDEVWKKYIEDQKPEEPDDNFKVVWPNRTEGSINPASSRNPKPPPLGGGVFTIQTLADDLTKFITALNAGPVHLVSWSYGSLVAMSAAVKNPSLVRSLILYEPAVISVLPAESAQGKLAREDRSKMLRQPSPQTRPGIRFRQPSCYSRLRSSLDLAASTASRGRSWQGCSIMPGRCRWC
jgi:pimeloyl-ACP methyl ester carboxylesterase